MAAPVQAGMPADEVTKTPGLSKLDGIVMFPDGTEKDEGVKNVRVELGEDSEITRVEKLDVAGLMGLTKDMDTDDVVEGTVTEGADTFKEGVATLVDGTVTDGADMFSEEVPMLVDGNKAVDGDVIFGLVKEFDGSDEALPGKDKLETVEGTAVARFVDERVAFRLVRLREANVELSNKDEEVSLGLSFLINTA